MLLSVKQEGSTFTELSRDKLASFSLPLPPLSEQRAIVRYLDYVDERIRRYITARQKLIDLLEEEKQAIINHAVTRGLDPNVRLKPSGVDWLGDVPEHWQVQDCNSQVVFTLSQWRRIVFKRRVARNSGSEMYSSYRRERPNGLRRN